MRKRASKMVKILVFVMAAYAIWSLVQLKTELDLARAAQLATRQEVAAQAVANAEIEYKLEHRDDDEVLAKIASDELGLRLPGERVFFN